jgi:hypothetical protein
MASSSTATSPAKKRSHCLPVSFLILCQFQAYSREILKQATANSENMFEEIWDMSKATTSHALFLNMAWPNVTLPHFDIRAHDERSRVEFVGFAPFVTPETREGWEAYSVENQDWIAQAYAYCDGIDQTPEPIPTTIHRYESSGEDPWFTVSHHILQYARCAESIFVRYWILVI